jgi:hypothetical protein
LYRTGMQPVLMQRKHYTCTVTCPDS